MRKLLLTAIAAVGFLAPMAPAQVQAQSNPYIGQLADVGFGYCPRAWAEANGQLLVINSNDALFSLLGTTFGGDGRTTFGLPDLRSRNPVHVGTGPGVSSVRWGQRGGAETVTLNPLNLPSHTHAATSTLHATTAAQGGTAPANKALASAPAYSGGRSAPTLDAEMVAGSATSTLAPSGGNIAFPTTDPFLVNRWCISLFGVYPSRN